MGSRGDTPAVYWLEPGKEQCVVGCFRGTLDQLEAKVKETHANNPEHLKNYLKFIKNVRAYQEACTVMAYKNGSNKKVEGKDEQNHSKNLR
jgi:hypothetical protein